MQEPSLPPRILCSDHAFFLDLDGTLAPIVEQPELAAIPEMTRDLLARLLVATDGAVAILSGRSLADVDRILDPMTLSASGSHGSELRAGEVVTAQHRIPDGIADKIATFANARNLLVERKPSAVALHYRRSPEHAVACRSLIDTLANGDPNFRALHGKMVSELTLAAYDKGSALEDFATAAPFKGRLPVMVGDDVTDEDGFKVAQARGGLGIKIGEGPSLARYRLDSVPAFSDWLASILN